MYDLDRELSVAVLSELIQYTRDVTARNPKRQKTTNIHNNNKNVQQRKIDLLSQPCHVKSKLNVLEVSTPGGEFYIMVCIGFFLATQ